MIDKKVWDDILLYLVSKEIINEVAYQIWLKDLIVEFDQNIVKITFANNLAKEKFSSGYADIIKNTLYQFNNEEIVFEYFLKDENNDNKKSDKEKLNNQNKLKKTGEKENKKEQISKSENINFSQINYLNPRYTFDNFVIGKNNQFCAAAALRVAQAPGQHMNPLFIYGGVGLGKTHLLQAIGHAILKKNPKIKVIYTNAEKFTNEFINALRTKTIDKFKKRYREIDVLLIDDIQFIAGKEGTQEEFFHTFNDLYQKDKQIVITSDRLPKAIPALEERLVSRFSSGLIADISPPDLETRLAILKMKCQERNYFLDSEILHYLATHIQKNVRELEGALSKIIVYHQLNKITPTLESVKKLLADLTSQPKKSLVSLKDILNAVAEFYGLKVSDLIGTSRRRELVIPRQVAMYLMREETNASFPLIAQEMGGRDHTTAIHSYNKIKNEIAQEGRIKQEVDYIKERLYS